MGLPIPKIIPPVGRSRVSTQKSEHGWEKWFAWRPVTVNGERIWFKTVYRRCLNTYVDYDDWKRYEYGDIFDVLKQ